jgi:hypothetical protein
MVADLPTTFAISGGIGTALALLWIQRSSDQRLEPLRSA